LMINLCVIVWKYYWNEMEWNVRESVNNGQRFDGPWWDILLL
jgi:hypothetical protein